MARIQRQVDYDWTGANASIHQAMTLAPGIPENLVQAAFMAQIFGRFEQALRLTRQALELDPLNAESWSTLGENEFYAGRSDKAVADIKKALELNPDNWVSPIQLGEIYVTQGRFQEALRESEQIKVDPIRIRTRAIAYSALGREKESAASLRELAEKYQGSAAFSLAMVYAYRNRRDEAFKWLDRAYAQHDGGLVYVKVHPLLQNLRGDPRYTAFLKKLHIPA
jgi:tetratricopeptide (TPR) repeat protein